MLRKLLCAASAVFVLGACSQSAEPEASEEPAALETPMSQREADPEAFHNSIQAAMEEVPSDMQARFQILFACEVRKNNQRPNPYPVDAQYIRALTQYLKDNPTAGNSCR